MNFLDRLVLGLNPVRGLERIRARAAAEVLMNYDAASGTTRGANLKGRKMSADSAAAKRGVVADRAQDLIRNTAIGNRAIGCLAANTIGDGIVPKIEGTLGDGRMKKVRDMINAHFNSAAIDATAQQNLYGLQNMMFRAIVGDGEVLIRRRRRERREGLPLPFQLEVIEGAYLDDGRDLAPMANGSYVRGGIQFNAIGQREGYWLFYSHPGESTVTVKDMQSRLVPASEVIHCFRPDRPGQTRGVSWLAPVMMTIRDMADYQDADIVGKKVSAAFAGFITGGETTSDLTEDLTSIKPGRLQYLRDGEGIEFPNPPKSDGFGPFMKFQIQTVAAGIGATYEALSGDFSMATFSSARMGRIEFDGNIRQWQWLMFIPQVLDKITQWTVEALAQMDPDAAKDLTISWVPPPMALVNPLDEIEADQAEVAAGFASRQGKIRQRGYDPEEILKEQIEDKARADAAQLVFTTGHNAPPAKTEAKGAANGK